MSAPDYWDKAKKELGKADPIMKKIIKSYKGEAMQGKNDAFVTLMRAIVGQQISVKAADSIYKRLETGLGGMTVENALVKTPEQFREFGLTRQKSLYAADLTQYFQQNQPTRAKWDGMTDEEIIKDLISIKGIGRWTAEMFLMFHLQRPDVLPLGDLALVKAMYNFYNAGEKLENAVMLELAVPWQPYRTVASWYLWRTYDIEAINY
jgi:DNA-3-methyladenine glycosylase II